MVLPYVMICTRRLFPCWSPVLSLCDSVSFFFERQGQPVLQVFCVRAIFSSPNSEEHQVTGSKPVSVSELFVDFPVSGVVRAQLQKVELCCNVKLLDDMPPRLSQWNFLFRVLVGSSRPM